MWGRHYGVPTPVTALVGSEGLQPASLSPSDMDKAEQGLASFCESARQRVGQACCLVVCKAGVMERLECSEDFRLYYLSTMTCGPAVLPEAMMGR